MNPSSAPLHFALFPFMSKGHTIPQLHIARLLSQRNLSITIFTTPKNSGFIRTHLSDIITTINIQELPFPQTIPGIPSGIESTEQLPDHSQSLFVTFANSTIAMQPSFELALESLNSKVDCIIYDWFLYWAQDSAHKFNIPTFTFNGMSMAVQTLYWVARTNESIYSHLPHGVPFSFPQFLSLSLTKNDFNMDVLDDSDPDNPTVQFSMRCGASMSRSRGLLVNSFYQLGSEFVDHWNKNVGMMKPQGYCIGPLCLVQHPVEDVKPKPWIEWLNQKQACGQQVLYISLGSQAQISQQQLDDLATGLEKSSVNFLWVLKKSMSSDISSEFEQRVQGRGYIVKDWVDQTKVLQHGAITGFLSHCGWNSVMEAICAGKPILALPLFAEQHMNAKLVVDEFGIGLRIAESGEVEKMVRELMWGDSGDRVRRRVEELKEAAKGAMKDGGSSWCTLNHLIDKVQHGKFDTSALE